MALYIAVYDIHPGDRKHIERLLGREGDKRKNQGEVLYIEVFGSVDALLATPMKYDLFVVDAVDILLSPDGRINMDIASKIRKTGSNAPIALFYPEDMNGPVNASGTFVRGFKKPTTQDIISDIVSWSIKCKTERVPRIELRGEFETFYVTPREIIYAMALSPHEVNITLTEGRSAKLFCDMVELSVLLDDYPCFLEIGREAIINMDHVVSLEANMFTMSDGESVPVSFFESFRISGQYKEYLKASR